MDNFLNLIKKDFHNDKRFTEIESFIFEIILKHIKDLIFIMKVENDDSFTYLFVNDIGIQHAKFGSKYNGKTFYDLQPKEIADHLHEKYSIVREQKQPYSFQDKLEVVKDTFTYGETILTPILNEKEEVIYIIGVTRDITERMNEKGLLVESQQMYKSLVDHNMDAVFSLDLEGQIRSVNPSAISMMNVVDSLIGLSIFDLFQYEFQRVLNKSFDQTVKGIASEGETSLLLAKKNMNVHYKTVPIITNEEVSGIFLLLRDITEKAKQAAVIEHMAYHDPLTGLLNRSALKKDLKELLALGKQNKQPLALMFMDLDRFKMLNDTLGHNSGDKLLIEVSKRLEQINHQDFNVYRYGGDEFIVVLQNTSRNGAESVAEQMIRMFKEPFYINEILYFISLSIGISIFPDHSENEDVLITKADKALYFVKQRSRADFQFYAQEMEKNTNELLLIETALRRAVEHDELVLYYQPQIDLASGEIVSYEALLRWKHPVLGIISPAKFIPIAEESGLIIPIGEWVIEEVCKQLWNWNEAGVSETVVAINLSAKQFQQPHLVDMIESLFNTYSITPSQIEFEITEGALQNAEEALVMIQRLKNLGVMISIDDFGTGFSSLMYLKQFPIDSLKIDQSFIKDVLNDKKDEAIVTTILHLAYHLDLSVIAEGIETQEQLEFLSRMNCQKGQGYLFSRPVHPEVLNRENQKS